MRARSLIRHRAGGFTLLEVLLSIAIIALLVVTGLAFYSHASDVRSQVFAQVDAINGRRLVMERMTADLRIAIAGPQGLERLDGGWDHLSLDTADLPGRAAWNRSDDKDHPPPPQSDVRRVGYQLRISVDEEGVPVVDGLERSCDRLPSRQVVDDAVQPEAVLLTPQVRFLRLRYWDGAAWNEGWNGNGLPAAVEITVGMDPLPEGVEPAEYPFETFRRVVHLPGSQATIAAGRSTLGAVSGGGR